MTLVDTWQSTVTTMVEEIPPIPPPTKATLAVNTIPVKGRIYLDGVDQGVAPITLELDPGTYVISFGDVEDHTTPEDVTVTLAEGEILPVTGEYTRLRPVGPPIPTWAWWAMGGAGAGIGGLMLYLVMRGNSK